MNPFHFAAPVDGGDLIDRDLEAERLLTWAEEANNTRLSAPRRYGKTSLLRRVLRDADRLDWIGVYVDFFGVVSLSDVAKRIERAYAATLRGPVARWFDGFRRSYATSVKVGVPGAIIGADLQSQATSSLLDRLNLPVKVAERAGRRVLVVFDEFQGVLTAQDDADAVIRSEIQYHSAHASYIFAGSHVGMMQELFADRSRALYAQARPLELPPLPLQATAEFIAERFDGTDKDVGAALAPLLDVCAGHPQRTMLLAHRLWELTDSVADEETFALAIDEVMAEASGEIESIWSRLTVSQRRSIAAIADGRKLYSRGSDVGGSRGSAVSKAVGSLQKTGEIVKDPDTTSGWRIVDPLLQFWITRARG